MHKSLASIAAPKGAYRNPLTPHREQLFIGENDVTSIRYTNKHVRYSSISVANPLKVMPF